MLRVRKIRTREWRVARREKREKATDSAAAMTPDRWRSPLAALLLLLAPLSEGAMRQPLTSGADAFGELPLMRRSALCCGGGARAVANQSDCCRGDGRAAISR